MKKMRGIFGKKTMGILMLCIAVLVQASAVFAYNITPYVGDGLIRSTPITLKMIDAEGRELSGAGGFANSTKITAQCRIKPGSDFAEPLNVSLILAAYRDGSLAGCAVSDKITFQSQSDSARALEAVWNRATAEEIDGVKVYLWDSIENARPLFTMGQTGSLENQIEGILVGGERVMLDTEAKTGTVEVNAGYTQWPEVIVLTNNLLTEVSVDLRGAFPLSKPNHTLVASNTAVSGESKTAIAVVRVGGETYNISVTQAVPQITDVRFLKQGAEMKASVQYDVQNPVWTAAVPGPNKEATATDAAVIEKYYNGVKTLAGLSFPYVDKTSDPKYQTFFLFDIAPELIGAQMFSFAWVSSPPEPLAGDGNTFTIDRSARIYMQDANGVLGEDWVQAQNIMASTAALKNQMYYEMRTSPTGNSVQTATGDKVFYKDFEVEPGSRVQVTLPATKAIPKIFVKYKDSVSVTNASYVVGGTKTEVGTSVLYRPIYIDPNKAEADGKYKPASQVKNDGTVTGNLLFATTTFCDGDQRQICMIEIPDELEGAAFLQLPFRVTGATEIAFDLNAAARVYLLTNAGHQAGSTAVAALKQSLGAGWRNTHLTCPNPALATEDTALAFRSNDTTLNSTTKNDSSFCRDFALAPGESEHVQISLPSITGSTRVFVMIKPLEE